MALTSGASLKMKDPCTRTWPFTCTFTLTGDSERLVPRLKSCVLKNGNMVLYENILYYGTPALAPKTSTETVFYAESTAGIGPFDGVSGADEAAGAALQTAFVVENQFIPFGIPLVVFRRTDDQAGAGNAVAAAFFFYGNVGLLVDF